MRRAWDMRHIIANMTLVVLWALGIWGAIWIALPGN